LRSPTQCPVLLPRLLPQWLLWLPLPSPTGVPLSMPLPSVVGLRLRLLPWFLLLRPMWFLSLSLRLLPWFPSLYLQLLLWPMWFLRRLRWFLSLSLRLLPWFPSLYLQLLLWPMWFLRRLRWFLSPPRRIPQLPLHTFAEPLLPDNRLCLVKPSRLFAPKLPPPSLRLLRFRLLRQFKGKRVGFASSLEI
jgi:hypothetical protein